MTSEIRTNSLTSRAGLSTVTLTDSGPMFSGITTFVDNSTFSVGTGGTIHAPATNTLNIGVNNTESLRIDSNSNLKVAGIVTATHFYGDGSNLSGITGVTINGNVDNRLVTATGTTGTLNGESNLTFDGTTLTVSGNASANSVQSSFGGITTRLGFVSGSAEGVVETTSNHSLVLGVNSNEKLRIDSNGYLSFAGDTDTYIHHPQANQLAITIGGGSFPIVRFGTGGSNSTVGFSTDSTLVTNAERISVRGFSSFKSYSNVYAPIYTHNEGNTSGTYNPHLLWNAGGANRGGIGYMPNNGELIFNNQNAINFATGATHLNGTTRLIIRSDGKVVIGTNAAGATLSVTGNIIADDGTNARITLQADGTSTNQILSTTTGFGSYCNMSYQAAAHVFKYGGNETFRINADGTFQGKPDQVNGRDTNSVIAGKSFKYTTSNISPSWGSGSNGWYSFYHMSDGVYTFWLHTGAHSSICFTASNGYDNSLKSYITVHHFINNANGNYGNVKGIRVTTDGVVQVYLHASAANNYFEMYVQVTCGDITNMSNLYSTITKETGSPTINDSWGTSDAYSPARGAHTTDGVCSPRILHNRQEMSCFATSTSLYGANTSGSKGFYWDPGTASCQSAQPRNTGWSAYYINKHDGNGGSENRYIDFWLNNGQQGNITISGSGLNYGSNSDYRLKKDDVVMTDGIARVKQLRPIKFKWIKDNIDDEGFFAHEAQAVVPIAVDGTKDQVVLQSEVDAGTQREDKSAGEPIYQTMDNSKLVPVLTASIKELITKVETLEQENIALRARVTNLEGN